MALLQSEDDICFFPKRWRVDVVKLLDELHVALEPEDPEFLKKFSKDSIVLPYFKWMPQAVRRILSKLDLVDLLESEVHEDFARASQDPKVGKPSSTPSLRSADLEKDKLFLTLLPVEEVKCESNFLSRPRR
mgnify:FL=1